MINNLIPQINTALENTSGQGNRMKILAKEADPILVTPVPAFAMIGFGMYTAFNNCFG